MSDPLLDPQVRRRLAVLRHAEEVTGSGVRRILKRLSMNRLPASQRCQRHDRRWKRYEKQQPGDRGADRR
jgi:hypothetical protein